MQGPAGSQGLMNWWEGSGGARTDMVGAGHGEQENKKEYDFIQGSLQRDSQAKLA